MQRIDFEDTTITRQPYVTIDNVDYEVQEGTYQGGTDLDADTFNTLQDNIEEALSNVGGNEIAISETEPTTETTKLWINSGEIGSQASEITNSYSTSTGIGYSANYVNNINTYSGTETRIGTWLDGKPLYRIVLQFPNGTGTTSIKEYTLADYGITNVDTIFIVHPSYYSLGATRYPFQYNDGSAFACNVNATKLNVTLGYNQISNSPFLITLEYTKTTD